MSIVPEQWTNWLISDEGTSEWWKSKEHAAYSTITYLIKHTYYVYGGTVLVAIFVIEELTNFLGSRQVVLCSWVCLLSSPDAFTTQKEGFGLRQRGESWREPQTGDQQENMKYKAKKWGPRRKERVLLSVRLLKVSWRRGMSFFHVRRVAAWSLGAEQVKTPPVVGPGESNKEPSGLLTAVPELACSWNKEEPKDSWPIYSSPWDLHRMQSCRTLRTCGYKTFRGLESYQKQNSMAREAQQTPGCLVSSYWRKARESTSRTTQKPLINWTEMCATQPYSSQIRCTEEITLILVVQKEGPLLFWANIIYISLSCLHPGSQH